MELTKKAFAAACGVSIPTVYAWIEKNRDGIKDYIHGGRIDAGIFDREPWDKYKAAGEGEAGSIDALRAAQDALNAAKQENETLSAKVEALQEINAILREQIAAKDQQIQAMLVTMNRQLAALPQPKKTLRERWDEWRAARHGSRTEETPKDAGDA